MTEKIEVNKLRPFSYFYEKDSGRIFFFLPFSVLEG